MRRRVLIVLAALLLAGLSAVSVALYARGADRRAVADRQPVWVLLADQRIPAGTTGAQIRVRKLATRVQMPAETVPDGTLRDLDASLDSLRLNADLAPKQLLMRGQFSTGINTVQGAGVPDGKLAVSVEVTMAPGVAEKVAGGDRVTVFVTYPKDLRASEQKTRILLPAATVISIVVGTPTPSDVTPSPSPTPTKTRSSTNEQQQSYPATLAVSPADAVRLVHAAQTGLIYLALVGAGTSVSPAPAVNYSSLWQ
jgi:pilus assembly protein CpaB